MPLIDINNPDIIKFLIESYEKTAKLRMRWNNINADKLNQAATLQHEAKGYSDIDVIKSVIDLGMPAVTRDNKSDARNRRLKAIRDGVYIPGVADLKKGHSIVNVGLGDPTKDPRLTRADTDLSTDPIMRPVDPKHMEILYKGKPDFGRKVYLKKRYDTAIPENRYYFTESNSWSYGWRLKDSYLTKHAPKHGRVWQLAREKSRSGPEPDPIHYKNAGTNPSKCSS